MNIENKYYLRNIILISIIITIIIPVIPLAVWSFSHTWRYPYILPQSFNLRAWQYIGSPYSKIFQALFNSIIIALGVTLLSIIIGIPAARIIGTKNFKGKELLKFIFITPIIVPGIAASMGIHVLFIKLGLADTITGVIIVHLLPSLPYMVIMMSGIFSNYNIEFENQAYSLGANKINTFFNITLPAIFPGILIGSLFVFLISWSQYILTLLIGGGKVITLPILLFSFANSGDKALTGALSIVFITPAILILILSSNFLSGKSTAFLGVIDK